MDKLFNNKKVLIASYVFLLLTGACILYLNCDRTNLWIDECYTLFLLKYSYSEIWSITAEDVHPPLYYWLTKAFSSLFSNPIVGARFFSGIPIFLSLIAGCTIIRKTWGNRTAFVFMFFVILHPSMSYVFSDLRMYSLAMFFVLMTYLYARKFYEEDSVKNIILLSFFALCGAYTQYYALLSIAGIVMALFVVLLLYKKKSLPKFVIVCLICIVGFLPWLGKLLSQMSVVSGNYWIAGVPSIFEIKDFFVPFKSHAFPEIFIFLTFAVLLVIGCYAAWKQKEKRKVITEVLVLCFLSVFNGIIGIAYSLLIRPVFINRYFYCSILLFFLAIGIFMLTIDLKKKMNLTVFSLFLLSFVWSASNKSHQSYLFLRFCMEQGDKITEFVNETMTEDCVFLYSYGMRATLASNTFIYPKCKHIAKVETLTMRDQTLELTPHIQINSFDELTENHKQIFMESNDHHYFEDETNEDAISLLKNYEVVRSYPKDPYYIIYELKRK